MRAKSGKPLGRYFPEMVGALRDAEADKFVIDGELTMCRDGMLSFEALQDRLHPAESRIRKLAAATPAQIILFDCLAAAGTGPVLDRSLPERRNALATVFAGLGSPERFRVVAVHPATGTRRSAGSMARRGASTA